MNKMFFILVLGVLFTGCSFKEANEYKLFQDDTLLPDKTTVVDEKIYKDELSFENIIAPNDRVDITVYIQAGEGSQQMTSMLTSRTTNDSSTIQENAGLLVTKRGEVRLPLLGTVHISGLTQDEAANMLIEEYKKFIRNPYVMVEIKNQRIIVMGEVASPGIVSVTNGTMNVIEAIATSGDFTSNAARTNLKVIRGDLRNPEVRVIDLTKMSSMKVASLFLKPNDILYVQPRSMTGYNNSFSEVSPFFNMISTILGTTSNGSSLQLFKINPK